MKSACLKIGLLFTGFLFCFTAWSQTKKISGRVTSGEDNQPLAGVSVLVKNKSVGTQTTGNGEFSIDVSENDVLVFSYSGYTPEEVAVGSASTINISMKAGVAKMDEVVVVGYGTQSRRNVTSAVSKMDKEVLANAPRSNVGSALQGTVSGLQAVNATGQPGAGPILLLRGGASINSPGAPLVVIDGTIRSYNDIASEDIASIELLKDAASTAIYGARANNGVILITTKQGKVGTSQVSYKFTGGYNKRREGYNYLNAKDYIYYARLGNLNSGISLASANATRGMGIPSNVPDSISFDIRQYRPDNAFLLNMGWDTVGDPYGGTIIFRDHGGEVENLVFRNTYTQDHYLNFLGGNDKGKYFASLDYYKEGGIIVGSDYKRYSANLNGSYKVKPNVEVSTGVILSTSSQLGVNGSEVNNLYRNLTLWPTFNPWTDSAQTKPNPGNGINDGNPLYWLNKTVRKNEVNKATLNGSVKWDLLPGLYFKATASGYLEETFTESFTKATQSYAQLYSNPPSFNTTRPAASFSRRDFQQTYNGLFNYTKTFNQKHNVGAMLGAEYYKFRRNRAQVSGTNAPTDDIPTVNASTTFAPGSNFSDQIEQRILSQFGNLNYNYDQRYLLTAVFRRDGISSIAKDNRWGFFPGMSAGWNIHRENFFQNSGLANFISTLKPRVSYGVNGNIAGLGFYDVQGIYASQGNYNGSAGFLNTDLVNNDLRWEKSKTTDVGADVGFLNDRITLLFDYYNRKTSDLLTGIPLPSYIGFGSSRTNLGTFQNKGYEFTVNASILRSASGFNLSVGANASFVKNKILKLPFNGNENNRQGGFQIFDPGTGKLVWVSGLQEGQPLGAIYGFKQVSIFKDDAEITKVAANRYDNIAKIVGPGLPLNSNNLARITPGDVNWLDVDKNDTIDTRDQVYLGNINPKWTGGFTTNLSYKGFSLYTRFEFAVGHTIYNDLVARTLGQYQGTFNYIDWQKDAWSPSNPNSDLPKVYSADQRNAPQGKKNYTRGNNAGVTLNGNNSRLYEKGDYLANREMTLSYDFSRSLLSKTKVLAQSRIYVSASNLFYVTKFSGPTPEPPVNPGTTTINGIYQGTYPTPRSYVLGVQVTF